MFNLKECSENEFANTKNSIWKSSFNVAVLIVQYLDKNRVSKLGQNIKSYELNKIYNIADRFENVEQITDSELHTLVNAKLNLISNFLLNKWTSNREIGLYSGDSGVLLALSIYYMNNGEDQYLDKIYNAINTIEDTILNNSVKHSFSCGIAGYGWVINYIAKNGIIQLDNDYFDSLDNALEDQLVFYCKNKKFDQLHEAISIGRYFLMRNNNDMLSYLIECLNKNAIKSDNEIKWQSTNYNSAIKSKYKFDFGLAHGMAGIMYFLAKCYRLNIKKDMCQDLISGILKFYENNKQNHSASISYYPAYVSTDNYKPESRQTKSRLAWCYGDAGILYSMYLTGTYINDTNLQQNSLKKLKIISFERDIISAGVVDAGFCHGASGLAYIFNRLFHMTNDTIFDDATKYWLKVAFIHGRSGSTPTGYLFYVNGEKWFHTLDILEGVSGVALTLLSYENSKFMDWDESLMFR